MILKYNDSVTTNNKEKYSKDYLDDEWTTKD